ncbi:MAG TPA: hypothetical protein DEQ14_01355 [Treponema sp.]|nr:hypothetical protein [Treponema sp.]
MSLSRLPGNIAGCVTVRRGGTGLITISHYNESAQLDAARLSTAPPPEKPEEEDSSLSEPGAFAKILAGLLGKTGAENPRSPGEGGVDGVLLAENENFSIDSIEMSDLPSEGEGLSAVERRKNSRVGKISGKDGSGEDAGGAGNRVGVAETERNLLFGAELLVSRGDFSGVDGADGAETGEVFSGEAAGLTEVPGELSADFDAELRFAGMSGRTDDSDGNAGLAEGTLAGRAAETAEMAEAALTAADGGENLKATRKNVSGKEQAAGADEAAFESAAELADGRNVDRRAAEIAAAQGNGEGRKGQSRLEEARSRERRGEKSVVEVRDLRTGASEGDVRAGASAGVNFEAAVESGSFDDAGNREITLELRLSEQGQKSSAPETSWEARSGRAFEDLLARELHNNFNNDIVRHASMILRDEGKGSIRLALRPESLGDVKIRLEMAENKITGHIIVESEEALRAFEKEIHSLEQAFKDSGFEGAALEMSLASDGRGTDQFQQEERTRALPGFFAASRYESGETAEMELPGVFDLYQRRPAAVNMLA